MRCSIDLLIPGLCGPLPELTDLQNDKNLSSLINLLAKSEKNPTKRMAYSEQLCTLMGFESDLIPSAELSLAGHGIETEAHHWMHADPVHMLADLDHAVLYDSNSLQLEIDEAELLVTELNHHFVQDGVEFVIADANHWFVKFERPLDVKTTHLNDVIMQNVNQYMPVGADGVFCKQVLNESQMLLYSNTVNHKRESEGLLTANSVWLWGQGKLNAVVESPIDKCFGGDVFLCGLSKHLNVNHASIEDTESLFAGIEADKRQLIVFDDLSSACNYGDVSSWLCEFTGLFDRYLSPLLDYAVSNRIEINLYPCNGYQYVINSKTKYRFWRRGNLEEYFGNDYEDDNKKT